MLEKLKTAHEAARLQFFGQHQQLADAKDFASYLEPLRKIDWVVYAKRPFAGPEAVLAYLSRYTHRVAISNRRLIACDKRGVTFQWKDYRAKRRHQHKTMTLTTDEFMRRFLIHILPRGFHRIRHYGLFANHIRVKNVQRLRDLINNDRADNIVDDARVDDTSVDAKATATNVADDKPASTYLCKSCGAPMIIIEIFEKQLPRAPPLLS